VGRLCMGSKTGEGVGFGHSTGAWECFIIWIWDERISYSAVLGDLRHEHIDCIAIVSATFFPHAITTSTHSSIVVSCTPSNLTFRPSSPIRKISLENAHVITSVLHDFSNASNLTQSYSSHLDQVATSV
jgi:hypothetical protein